jgi:NADP-dependent 3-hydroxy acid dehydrogenase YdfG
MRYKQLISDKLDQLHNQLNILRHQANTRDMVNFNQTLEQTKEKIESIQTLINNEQ